MTITKVVIAATFVLWLCAMIALADMLLWIWSGI